MSEIVPTSVKGEGELEKWSARQVENVSPSSTSSRGGMFFDGVLVSVENLLLNQSRASGSNNSLITTNLSH